MDILESTLVAMQRGQLIELLRGDGEYMIETSQYAPGAESTDVGRLLSQGIYKVYKQNTAIKNVYEDSLMQMLDRTDYDVYLVCIYMASQLFKEHNGLAPFILNKDSIIKKLSSEIMIRKKAMKLGIYCPSGYININAWKELERFNSVCKEEYQVELFE